LEVEQICAMGDQGGDGLEEIFEFHSCFLSQFC